MRGEELPTFDLNCFNIYECPVTYTMDIVGGKWKMMIVYLIAHDVNRFGKLYGLLEGVSKRTLTKQLRDLEEDGIVDRKVYAEVPPRVEYSLTSKGNRLLPVLKNIYEWGVSEMRIEENR